MLKLLLLLLRKTGDGGILTPPPRGRKICIKFGSIGFVMVKLRSFRVFEAQPMSHIIKLKKKSFKGGVSPPGLSRVNAILG